VLKLRNRRRRLDRAPEAPGSSTATGGRAARAGGAQRDAAFLRNTASGGSNREYQSARTRPGRRRRHAIMLSGIDPAQGLTRNAVLRSAPALPACLKRAFLALARTRPSAACDHEGGLTTSCQRSGGVGIATPVKGEPTPPDRAAAAFRRRLGQELSCRAERQRQPASGEQRWEEPTPKTPTGEEIVLGEFRERLVLKVTFRFTRGGRSGSFSLPAWRAWPAGGAARSDGAPESTGAVRARGPR
jgi:hypothetical protein